MDLKSQIDTFINDNFSPSEEYDFDFNTDNLELEYAVVGRDGIHDFNFEGDPEVEFDGSVTIQIDELESKLLEFATRMQEQASSTTTYARIVEALRNKTVLTNGISSPMVIPTEEIACEILISIEGEYE